MITVMIEEVGNNGLRFSLLNHLFTNLWNDEEIYNSYFQKI